VAAKSSKGVDLSRKSIGKRARDLIVDRLAVSPISASAPAPVAAYRRGISEPARFGIRADDLRAKGVSAVKTAVRPLLATVLVSLFLVSSGGPASAHYMSNNNGAPEYFGVQQGVKGYGSVSIAHITGTSTAPGRAQVSTRPFARSVDALGIRVAVEYRARANGTITSCRRTAWKTSRDAWLVRHGYGNLRALCGRGYYRVWTQGRFRVETQNRYVTGHWMRTGWHGLL
jgi:hypothetical protein